MGYRVAFAGQPLYCLSVRVCGWLGMLNVLIVLMKPVAAASIRVTLAGWQAAVGAPSARRGEARRPIHTDDHWRGPSCWQRIQVSRTCPCKPWASRHAGCLHISGSTGTEKVCVCARALLVTCVDDRGGSCVCRLVRGPLHRAAPFRLVLGQCPSLRKRTRSMPC